jgi:hypothetical protein
MRALRGQRCDINKNVNGICKAYSAFIEPERLLVGEECSEDMYWQVCGYGKYQCIDDRCAPIDSSMLCQSSNDCTADKYCNLNGECVLPKKLGSPCTDQEECGRTAACYYADLRKQEGKCVAYFSVAIGESVGTYTGHDNKFLKSTNMSTDFASV